MKALITASFDPAAKVRLARLVERGLVHDVRLLRAIDHAASSFAPQ